MAPLHIKSDEDDSDEISQYDMDAVTINNVKTKAREVFAHAEFPGQNIIEGKVDIGEMVTCMPASLLMKLKISTDSLKPSKALLRRVTGKNMKANREIVTKVTCNGRTAETPIIITELGSELILCIDFCKSKKHQRGSSTYN